MNSLQDLENQLKKDLCLLGYPVKEWLPSSEFPDVAIIGAGMAGLCASFALKREGICNQQVFDAAQQGYEGPWDTYARMLTLRSGKDLSGPALGLPNLTFRIWYTSQYGDNAWDKLYKIPTKQWMEYLRWYRKVLNLPITNKKEVVSLVPQKDYLVLNFKNGENILTKKVVLATGRAGFGGLRIPVILSNIPKKLYAHTNDSIDFNDLAGKNIVIIGAGASAFDAAAAALEGHAAQVTMLTRREKIPYINKFAGAVYPGFSNGYYLLPDNARIAIMENAKKNGSPPPFESLDRVHGFSNFQVLTSFEIKDLTLKGSKVHLTSTQDHTLETDFIIAATGFAIDGSKEPLLNSIFKYILLWSDQHSNIFSALRPYPYLGNHYQFLQKKTGEAPFLKNVYCFNYAAIMSHGLTSSDIPDISIGAQRLAKGIAADFFTQNDQIYSSRFINYDIQEFEQEKYNYIFSSNLI